MRDEGFPREFADVCRDVRGSGWKRVILLGNDWYQGPYSLKACLAQTGVLVLSPGAADREWLNSVAEARQDDEQTRARFAALLADGVEHGVQAVLATDSFLAGLAREAGLGVSLLDVGEARA